ncbi:hypothetical protein AlacWU_01238 [Aspergillus niger]|uniref:Uncharacterized protein n=2 Tax=Aspergillus niger TaxID=5061 RepID=A2QG14_ASPNC|nr:hypothetical protein An03g01510 [Aspergillus niger]GJP88339.1 hypothetical protein AlacWU_01238 [Aspergillus niger]CAK38124.1 hypothetical protein An03g01510 [Aspergillus niger]
MGRGCYLEAISNRNKAKASTSGEATSRFGKLKRLSAHIPQKGPPFRGFFCRQHFAHCFDVHIEEILVQLVRLFPSLKRHPATVIRAELVLDKIPQIHTIFESHLFVVPLKFLFTRFEWIATGETKIAPSP